MKKIGTILSLSFAATLIALSAWAQPTKEMQLEFECSQKVQNSIIERNKEEVNKAVETGQQERFGEFMRQALNLANAACAKLKVL